MNKLVTILVASTFAVAATGAFAADPPKPAAAPAAAAKPALEKPASVKAEDWAKMSDADKAKAVEKAKTDRGSGQEGKEGRLLIDRRCCSAMRRGGRFALPVSFSGRRTRFDHEARSGRSITWAPSPRSCRPS